MTWPRGLTAAMSSSAVNTPRRPTTVNCTPAFAADPPVSCHTAWLSGLTITSSPGRVSTRSATWLAIVPLGIQSAASLPSSEATCSCRRLALGSSPNWSSPTGAAAMTARIAGEGRVTVSERRSIGSDIGLELLVEDHRVVQGAAVGIDSVARDRPRVDPPQPPVETLGRAAALGVEREQRETAGARGLLGGAHE